MKAIFTHENFIHAIRDMVASRVNDPEIACRLRAVKLVYGAGAGTFARGVTYFNVWKGKEEKAIDLAEVCAFGEENPIQIAGTTIHELAHVTAGVGHGHDKEWKAYCAKLGLREAKAAGQVYRNSYFAQDIRWKIAELPAMTDGNPDCKGAIGLKPFVPRPCTLGIGTRGGKSRGAGSGSRLRKYECECGVKVRVASDNFKAHCDICGGAFERIV